MAALALASSAPASQTHRFERFLSEGGPAVKDGGLAVDQSDGDVYVSRGATLSRFDAAGDPAPFSFSASYISGNEIIGTPTGALGANSIAVAPPGAAMGTAGDLYVLGSGERDAVMIYAPSGQFLGRITEAGGTEYRKVAGEGLCGLTTDSAGNLYLASRVGASTTVDKFVPRSNPPTNSDFDSRVIGLPPARCAVAASGSDLYLGGPAYEGTYSLPLSLFPGGGADHDAAGAAFEMRVGGLPVFSESLAVDPAAGELYVDGVPREPLAEGLGGGRWSVRTASTAGTEAVSCPTGRFCVTVGADPGAVVYDEGEAREVPVPRPAGATGAILEAVSCASEDFCMAVGWSRQGNGRAPLAESWDGSSWSLVAVPAPADAAGSVIPAGVSCPTASSCELVGHYVSALDADGGPAEEKPLTESWDGSTWTARTTPAVGQAFATLNAVSCVAAEACTAVGNRRPGFGTAQSRTLAERLEGATWTIQPTHDFLEENSLEAVSCAGATSCMAVGRTKDPNNTSTGSGIAEAWNGSEWQVTEHELTLTGGANVTRPTNGPGEPLFGVSCVSTTSCVAVGEGAGAYDEEALIEGWDGSVWTRQRSAVFQQGGISPTSVSCADAGTCLMVGTVQQAGLRIAQLATDGATVSTFGERQLKRAGSRSLAIDSSEGAAKARHVYAAVATEVAVFGPQIAIADPVTGVASEVGGEGVTLNGTVDPDGTALTECHFEYGLTATYGTTVECEEPGFGEVGSGHGAKPVRARIDGLNGGTEYHFRLVVANVNSPSEGIDATFTTKGPGIDGVSVGPKTDTSARLEAAIDPRGEETSYVFEYVSEAQFNESGFAAATQVPAGGQGIGSGSGDVGVAQGITGLAPLTTYRFRVIASSPGGTNVGSGQSFTTYPASAPVSTGCANEALRALGPALALPDCRAYEQVTPVWKGGNNPQGEPMSIEAAASGEGVAYFVNGGLPGGEGAQEFPSYLSTRGGAAGGTGWATQGLLPPASTGSSPNAKVIGWDDELANAYDMNRLPEGVPTLYRRHSADRALTKVAEGTETTSIGRFALADTSADGGLVLFEEEGDVLVSGAAPEAKNVYLWSEADGLRLVDVLNDGQAPPEGAFAGPYEWFFGSKGTSQGGASNLYYTKAEHVLSADGSAAFFTAAGSGRIYERINPTQPQSAMNGARCVEPQNACTVEISASQKSNGEGLGGMDPNGPRPAIFLGATPSASSAFFMSPEELTDDATTGSVAIGRSGLDGQSVERGFLPAAATGVAVDAGHIYWVNSVTGSIGRANVDGSEREPHFITGASNPRGIAVDGGHIYWTNAGEGKNGEGTIGRADLDGGGADQSFITGASNPQGIAVDAEYIFWANAGSTAGTRRISRATLGGTGVIPGIVMVAGTSGPSGLAVRGSYVYWADPSAGAIGRVKVSGAEADQELVTGILTPLGVATDGEHVYWASSGSGSIGRADLEGGEPEQRLVSGIGAIHALADDGSHLYWSSNEGDQGSDLYRFDSSTGNLTDLTPDTRDVDGAEVKGLVGISEDGSYVYFVAAGHLAEGAPQTSSCTGIGGEVSGRCNLYLWHEGTTKFITQLESLAGQGAAITSDYMDWVPLASIGNNGIRPSMARVTPDGHVVVFRSRLRLTNYENHEVPEFYRSVDGGPPACLSCNPSGAAPVGSPSLQSVAPRLVGPKIPSAIQTRNLSPDGSRFFFDSPDALVPADVNGASGCESVSREARTCEDVYEWEAPGTGSCHSAEQDGGCLYLISTGTSAEPSYFIDAGKSGRDVFFYTGQPLVGQDKDQLTDVYDARELGGIAAQSPSPVSPCSGEGCRGPAPAASAPVSPGTATFAGPGNPPAPGRRSCPKGKKRVKRHGKERCVKVKRHHKRHRKHHSGKHRRRGRGGKGKSGDRKRGGHR